MCNFLPGTYLYILSCHRVCQQCLLGRERYLPLRPKQACSQFGLSNSAVRRIPRLYVPKYSPQSRSLRRWGHILNQRNTTGWLLIDREVVLREQLRNIYGSSADYRELLQRKTRQQIAQLHERRLDTGTASTPFTAPTEYSYSVSVLLPWLDRATQNVGRPEKCRACRFEGKSEALSFHCATGLQDHIDQHGPIVDGQHVQPSSE
ncbi:hypothetical protein NLG97_g9319 [Lecanicillium saksenae]|uniref:Uncharacterized protein n=1 Tax=Lecanicillium saksenae TaxID=468837 RepID=A0ACC1QGC4_9HYPO|nr:hypothetical protein NLG97_g9319 [Lecanicillium saksenae]